MIDSVINELKRRYYKFKTVKLSKRYPGIHVLETKINGYSLLVVPNTTLGHQILIKRFFEKNDTEFLKNYIKEDFTVIDIGSNIGYYTMLFAHLARAGKVFAVDPLQYHENMLQLSAKINRFENIDFERCAISDCEGTLTFCENPDGALSSIYAQGIEGVKIEVKSTTFDKYVEEKNITNMDLVKVDVEGAEHLLLLGAKESFGNKDVKVLMIEMCPGNLRNFNNRIEEIDALLEKYGYEGYYIDGTELKRFDPGVKIKSINVFYFSSSDLLKDAKKMF